MRVQRTLDYPTINLNLRYSAPYDHNARPSQTDRGTDVLRTRRALKSVRYSDTSVCCSTKNHHPWVDRGTFPLLFEVEGTPCVLSRLLFRESGVDIFVLMHTVFIG